MVEGCVACAVGTGLIEAPGGLIAETRSWAAEHCVGPYGVGAISAGPPPAEEAAAAAVALRGHLRRERSRL